MKIQEDAFAGPAIFRLVDSSRYLPAALARGDSAIHGPRQVGRCRPWGLALFHHVAVLGRADSVPSRGDRVELRRSHFHRQESLAGILGVECCRIHDDVAAWFHSVSVGAVVVAVVSDLIQRNYR